MIDVKIDTKKLLTSLKKLPVNIQKNIMTGAVRAGAKPLATEARNLVPKDTGNLRKSIGIIKRKSKNRNIVKFSVTPRKGGKNDGWYGHMIEFGTSNMKPQPFLRPAFENQDDQSVKEATKYIAKRLDKETKKASL